MHRIATTLVQGMGGLGAIALAVFCPQPGNASVLVPLGHAAAGDAALWASRERAQLVVFDPAGARVTVIAPTALSLVRALGYGLVPIAANIAPCGAIENGSARKIGSQE